MALIQLFEVPEELRARDLIVLDPGFILARYTKDSFSQIASKGRQLSFVVTLAVTDDAPKTVPWLQEVAAETSVTLIAIPVRSRPPESYLATPYTDVLPVHLSMYLDPAIPDEDGPKVRRLRELIRLSRDHVASGTKMPTPLRKELKRLGLELWSKARMFRFLSDAPGVLTFRFPDPGGISTLSVELDSGARSVSSILRRLHETLNETIGVYMDPYNAAALRDASLRARTELEAEAVLQACFRVIKERGQNVFKIQPYMTPPKNSSRPIKVQRQLEFLKGLMGDMVTVRVAQKQAKRIVAVSAEIKVRMTYKVR
ncbi:MAG: hypothetical protein QXP93_07135 [Nitrososphaerota archaeon]